MTDLEQSRRAFINAARRAFTSGFDSDQELASDAELSWIDAIRADERARAESLVEALQLYEEEHDAAEWERTGHAFGICRCPICTKRSGALAAYLGEVRDA